MCVLIYKPAGVEMPSPAIMKACKAANPHGQGFVTPAVKCKTLNFGYFTERLSHVAKDEPCIIHFRLATHGSISRRNCHPFTKNGVSFAHNGIIDIKPYGDKTDSETAFDEFLLPVIERYGLKSRMLDIVVRELIGRSKFAFMQGGYVRLFGNFTNIDGCLFSNTRFLRGCF